MHSPRACIPGGGWEIVKLENKTLRFKSNKLNPFKVNRVVIKRGEDTQLVYYWFKQRDRLLTNEYVMKWYNFWDSLVRNRSDGALIRMTTLVRTSESLSDGDKRLLQFAEQVLPSMGQYIPD